MQQPAASNAPDNARRVCETQSSDRLTATPAGLEVSGIGLTAGAAGSLCRWIGTFHRIDYFARPRNIALVDNPDLGPCMDERNFAESALRVFVEYTGFDANLPQQSENQVRVG